MGARQRGIAGNREVAAIEGNAGVIGVGNGGVVLKADLAGTVAIDGAPVSGAARAARQRAAADGDDTLDGADHGDVGLVGAGENVQGSLFDVEAGSAGPADAAAGGPKGQGGARRIHRDGAFGKVERIAPQIQREALVDDKRLGKGDAGLQGERVPRCRFGYGIMKGGVGFAGGDVFHNVG